MHGDRPTFLKLWVWWTKFTDDRSIIIEKDQLGNSLREKMKPGQLEHPIILKASILC